MSGDVWIGLLIAGLSRAMIYFLLASGLTLIFGVLKVINFAHGAFYMLGIFICYSFVKLTGSFTLAFLIIPLVFGVLLGGLTETVLFRRVYKAEHVMQLLLSIGVTYIIADVVKIIWGVNPYSLDMPDIFCGIYSVYGITITKYNVFIIVVSLVTALVMFGVLYKTKIGSIIRACTFSREMTLTAGVNVSRVFSLVFAAGIGLAGLASVTAAPMTTGMLGMDTEMIMIVFSIVIIGGAGSIAGALLGATIIGVVESLAVPILPEFAEVIMYVIVAIVLMFRPQGLFGKSEARV